MGVIGPQRILQSADAAKVDPTKFYPLSKDLQIVVNFLVCRLNNISKEQRDVGVELTLRGRSKMSCPPTTISTVATDRSSAGSPNSI